MTELKIPKELGFYWVKVEGDWSVVEVSRDLYGRGMEVYAVGLEIEAENYI